MLTPTTLVHVAERAELRVVGRGEGDELLCVYDGRWPDQVFSVAAGEPDLVVWLDAAGRDVDDLWPGRDRVDGAISLVAISLQSALDAREVVPLSVRLSHSRWLAEPEETRADDGASEATDREWRAPPRSDSAGHGPG